MIDLIAMALQQLMLPIKRFLAINTYQQYLLPKQEILIVGLIFNEAEPIQTSYVSSTALFKDNKKCAS